MASSKCIKCDSSSFEVKENTPSDSAFPIMFVQCKSCGGVFGTMSFFDAGIVAKDNQTEIAKLKNQLNDVQNSLNNITNRMR